jgi:histone H3/H4
MSYLMQSLTKKEEVDELIRNTIDKVLVLRIGRASDPVCMQLDEIVREILLCVFMHLLSICESHRIKPQKKKSSPLHFLILHLLDRYRRA